MISWTLLLASFSRRRNRWMCAIIFAPAASAKTPISPFCKWETEIRRIKDDSLCLAAWNDHNIHYLWGFDKGVDRKQWLKNLLQVVIHPLSIQPHCSACRPRPIVRTNQWGRGATKCNLLSIDLLIIIWNNRLVNKMSTNGEKCIPQFPNSRDNTFKSNVFNVLLTRRKPEGIQHGNDKHSRSWNPEIFGAFAWNKNVNF